MENYNEMKSFHFTGYYNTRQSVITIYDSLDYYVLRQHVITIYDRCVITIYDTCYNISRQVLQFTTLLHFTTQHTSPRILVGCDIHYTVRTNMLATRQIYIYWMKQVVFYQG